ncbi:unnamed protein product [Tuber melanosporum]|uniref:(Perigord truffle) hypothetical protein n=1 Tax=Tuber melanosporum (strain Mel28) TaxID=656061 RepID=D5GMG5_TUBMM|nr:uncharacterized protein GSTUM_00010694001 [Tuber melanosporum]CAZ85708.1 unnamed protein product [Tuber melanosporum]
MGSTTSTLRASTIILLALTPQALAADGADFSNNLFSDLAPVLALFGEQVSKQFLSQSLTWLEDVIFAMAPLGIVTAIVSAVRVGGPNWLKAIVGRARESRAVAEVELMSSTSHEVCELWNGEAIVRVMGSPEVAEILYFEDETDGQGGPRFLTLEAAKVAGILENVEELKSDPNLQGDASISAPNISLNICEANEQGELWLFAILGIVLQFGCLIFIGITRYHPTINWKDQNSEYAYPLMASGTLLVVMGMMACSRAVQASSEEDIWVSKRSFRILWVQKSSRVNDQHFGSYALFGDGERKKLITSRRAYKYSSRNLLRTLSIVGSFVCIAGFVTQFVGLRALHWSASVAQLVVTLAMTAARTWIRRKMSERPRAMTLPVDKDGLDGLTLTFGTSPDKLWGAENSSIRQNSNSNWEVITPHKYLGYEDAQEAHNAPYKDAQNIIRMRMELEHSTSWKGSSHSFVQELDACLRSLLACLMGSKDITLVDSFERSEVFRWAMPVKVDRVVQCITMTAEKSYPSTWIVNASELRAVISLWCYGENPSRIKNPYRLPCLGDDPRAVLRVLGPATHRFIRDCERWVDRGGLFAVVENGKLRGNTNQVRVTAQVLSETIARMRGHTDDTTGGVDMYFILCDHVLGTEPVDSDGCNNSLTLVSTVPLRQMCAQEILSSFLWAIVGTVLSINGDTQSRSATPLGDHESMNDERPGSKLENSFFRELAAIITNSGVTSNIQDAYALIIPPFAAAGKLPRGPSSELAQDEIESI